MVYYKDEAWRRWGARPGEETLMGTGILLCGLNGAGKNTLGKALADKLSFHYIDNEELYFPKNDPAYLYAVQRDREEVERLLLEETADHPDFVFTSVKGDYSEAVRARFQYAVWVDAPRELRLRRVRERSYQKFGDRMLPGGELYEQEEAFFRFVSLWRKAWSGFRPGYGPNLRLRRGEGMRILGIDPGYAIVGYGVVEAYNASYRPLEYGAVTTQAGVDFGLRLKEIYEGMTELLGTFRPQAAAVEKLFFINNKTTGIGVAEARGVILLALAQAGVPLFEYTPMQVKQAVTGYGKAQKHQVQEMTRRLLGLPEIPRPDDAADALAMAICHGQAAGSPLRRGLLDRI